MVKELKQNNEKCINKFLQSTRFLNPSGKDLRLSAVVLFLHFVDSHEPVLGRVRFLELLQFKILVADFHGARAIVTRWLI